MPSGSAAALSGAALALGLIGLTGCATDPKAALPAVQQQVAVSGGPSIEWPQTDSERAAVDRTIRELLAGDLTPDTAVKVAVLNNRRLRATFEDLGVSQADLIDAGLPNNPVFFADSRQSDRAPRGPDVEISLTAGVLDDLLIPVRKKVARAQLEAAEYRVAQAVLDLAAEAKVAAYTLEARLEFRSRLAAIVAANDAAADLARRQYEAGNINKLDLATQQAAAQEARLDLMRADAQIQADRETLNRLMGLSGAEVGWRTTGRLPALPAADPPLSDLEAAAVSARFDLAAARSRVSLARTAFDLKRKTRLLPAGVNLDIDTERGPDGGRVTGPGIELGVPIFNQGQADLARLGAQLRRAQDEYEGLAADIGSDVRAARNALLAARSTADYYDRTLLPQRRTILRETLLNYNAMQRNSYELLMAKEQEQDAERGQIEAVRDYWIARVRLEQVVGGRLGAQAVSPQREGNP